MVKTRKVLVLSFEVPLEAQAAVMAALGTPMPDAETWVAIARLRQPGAEPASVPGEVNQLPLPKPKSLAQIAGILCNTGAFQKWSGSKSADEAAEWLRGHCNVASRADLDTNEDAAAKFRDLKGEYEAWMAAPEAFSPRERAA